MKKIFLLTAVFMLIFTSCAAEHVHEFDEWTVIKNPTCTESGLRERFCSCGERQEAEIPSEGHKEGEWIVDTEKTCTAEGEKHLECSVCGEKLETGTIPAGHEAGEWIIDVEVTCSKDGKRHNECTVCGEILEEEVVATTGHKIVKDKAVAPTCTKTGLSEGEHCSLCGEIIKKQSTVPANGHKWGKDSCTVCGKEMVFGIGEKWVVEGQWEFTIDSVKAHYACNFLEDIEPGAAVVMIEYHYKNIGYVANSQDLYISALDIDVYDEKGFSGKMYPCMHKAYPSPCVEGTSSRAVYGFVIPSESKNITIVVEHILPGTSAQARFEVPVG